MDSSEMFLIKVIFTFMCVIFSLFNKFYKNQINSFYSIEQRKSFDKRRVRAEKQWEAVRDSIRKCSGNTWTKCQCN